METKTSAADPASPAVTGQAAEIGLAAFLRRRARNSAERPAVTFEGSTRTFAEVDDRVRRLARVLSERGVGPGDRVAYLGLNHPAFLEALFATAELGAVMVPLNWRLAGPELRYAVDHARVHTLLADQQHLPVIDALRDGLAVQRFLRTGIYDPDVAAADWEDVEALTAGVRETGEPVAVAPEDPALILYTSGTTGKAKGVVLTHGNLWWSNIMTVMSLDITQDDVSLICAPLFHAGALNITCLATWVAGGRLVIHTGFDRPTRTREGVTPSRLAGGRTCAVHGRRRAPASAHQRARPEHVGRRRVQPGLENGSGAGRTRRPDTARQLHRGAAARRSSRGAASDHELSGARGDGPGARVSARAVRGGRLEGRRAALAGRTGGRRAPGRGAGCDPGERLPVQRPGRRDRLPLREQRRGRRPEPDTVADSGPGRDPQLYYEFSTTPGARVPHARLELGSRPLSSLDLVDGVSFALLTGPGGEGWTDAATAASARTGVAISVHVIGALDGVLDPYGEWAQRREVGPSGCVLVRPDQHIAWRTSRFCENAAAAELTVVMERVLGLSEPVPAA